MTDVQPDTPKLPRGLALMVRNVIGVDPQAIFAEFQKAATTMVGFCKHFDMRMVNLTKEVRALRDELEQLKQDRFALPKPLINGEDRDRHTERTINTTYAGPDSGT